MKKTLSLMLVLVAAVAFAQQQAPFRRNNTLLNRNRPGRPGAAARPGAGQISPSPAASAASSSSAAADNDVGGRTIEFNQSPLEVVLKMYGDFVNKTVLKDPQCPSPTITLLPKQGQVLTDAEKIAAIEAVLEMNGVHLEPYGEKFVRALPRKDARKEGIPLIMDSEAELSDTAKVVSLMLPFKNITVEDAQKTLDNFKSASGIIIGFERNNSLLLTDTEVNINRMREIARAIDIATPVMENVFVRQIKYASAEQVKTALEQIVQEAQKEQEKSKTPANVNNSRPQPVSNRLLGGRGQNAQPAQTANESLVMGVSDAERGMVRGKVLILADERSNKLVVITSKPNMDLFDKLIEALDVETTPDTVVKVYRLKYADSEDVSDMINDLIGNAPSGKNSSKGNQNANAKKGTGGNATRGTTQTQKKSANQRTGDPGAGELSKDNTTVLSDKRINGIVVMTQKELVPVIESIIESMDIKLSQVLIETCIIEVTLGDDLETGVDWVRNGRYRKEDQSVTIADTYGRNKYNYTDGKGNVKSMICDNLGIGDVLETSNEGETYTDGDGVTWSRIGDPLMAIVPGELDKESTYANGNAAFSSMMGGGGGSASGTSALKSLMAGTANPIGGGLNYFFTSDALNLSAVIQASKTDSRTKYIASPIIMTLDNKEAVINATKMRYLLKGFTSSGNSYSTIAVPDYEQKELGIEIKVTPKINPNGTVMLTMEEKYSQVAGSQDIKYATGNTSKSTTEAVTEAVTGETTSSALETVNVDTTATREMSSDVLLENGQTVIFGGLTETLTTESETGIPILKDIPWIGKWLFGSVSQSESRSELLVFMTPYVLDDAEAAQVEAIRRKKTMSDARPWEDHGWSASPLADPVSKKEQMRRLKDEWKKQDQERKARMEIEQEKIKRVEKLKEMSKEERDAWLKLHAKELDEQHQEELEAKMLDEKSQEELKKLAADIRAKKLEKAEKELSAAEKVEKEKGGEK